MNLVDDLIGVILTYTVPNVTYDTMTIDARIGKYAYNRKQWRDKVLYEMRGLIFDDKFVNAAETNYHTYYRLVNQRYHGSAILDNRSNVTCLINNHQITAIADGQLFLSTNKIYVYDTDANGIPQLIGWCDTPCVPISGHVTSTLDRYVLLERGTLCSMRKVSDIKWVINIFTRDADYRLVTDIPYEEPAVYVSNDHVLLRNGDIHRLGTHTVASRPVPFQNSVLIGGGTTFYSTNGIPIMKRIRTNTRTVLLMFNGSIWVFGGKSDKHHILPVPAMGIVSINECDLFMDVQTIDGGIMFYDIGTSMYNPMRDHVVSVIFSYTASTYIYLVCA